MSDDGRVALFYSYSENLAATDTNGFPDIFLHTFSAEPPPSPVPYTPTASATVYPLPLQYLYLPLVHRGD